MKSHLLPASALCLAMLSVNTAHAFFTIPNVTVEDINPSASIYNYEVTSNCFRCGSDTLGGVAITELFKTEHFYVPYFTDAEITGISSPINWRYSIEASNDLFDLGNGAGVIHWEVIDTEANNGIDTTGALDGFSYTSFLAGSVKAPFRTAFSSGGTVDGDPPIPASPSALAAGLATITTVPVPAAFWLFGSSLLGFLSFKKSKQKIHL